MGATGTYRSKPSHAGNQDGEDQTATLMQESLRISLVGATRSVTHLPTRTGYKYRYHTVLR